MNINQYISRIGVLAALCIFAVTACMAIASHEEVRSLVAPIALYPDPLIAIILPASTYPDQVFEAASLNLNGDDNEINRRDWDISVRELAHYPRLLQKMNNAQDWTVRLGQVYVAQPSQVMAYIQWLRQRARDNGVLHSNGQQHVYLSGSYVYVVPAEPERIYCPDYDPQVVFSASFSNNGGTYLSFGAGLVIGAWLSYDTDWRHQRVTNYGWDNGGAGGWRTRTRSHITINNTYRTYYTTNINRTVTYNHNVYRRQVNQTRIGKYNIPERATVTRTMTTRPAPMRTTTTRTSQTRTSTTRTTASSNHSARNTATRPAANRPTSHGQSAHKSQPAHTTRRTMTRSTSSHATRTTASAHRTSSRTSQRSKSSSHASRPASHGSAKSTGSHNQKR